MRSKLRFTLVPNYNLFVAPDFNQRTKKKIIFEKNIKYIYGYYTKFWYNIIEKNQFIYLYTLIISYNPEPRRKEPGTKKYGSLTKLPRKLYYKCPVIREHFLRPDENPL